MEEAGIVGVGVKSELPGEMVEVALRVSEVLLCESKTKAQGTG